MMAGFSFDERTRANAKALLGGVYDAQASAEWYEGELPFQFTLGSEMVLTQADTLRANPAPDITTARTLAAGALNGIIQDASQPADAVRLTPVPGIDNTYVALSTYGDFSSGVIYNWVKPAFIPQSNGQPSIGYAIRLFDGDPNAGGTEIGTTDGQTGTGINKSAAWYFSYDNGILLLSLDNGLGIADPYIQGFYYIGGTAGVITTAPIQATISGTAQAAADLANSQAVSVGDRVSVQVVNSNNGSFAAANLSVSFEVA